jgi:hypothetical protein
MSTCPTCGYESEDSTCRCPQCGTDLPKCTAAPPPAAAESMVILRAFSTELEAQAAAQMLLAAGIPNLVAADNCGGAFPPLEIYRGVQILVRAADLERACVALADFEAEQPEVDAETAERAGTVPGAEDGVAGGAPGEWSSVQKTWLGFLIGLGLGAALTSAILNRDDARSGSTYTGVVEDDTDGDGKTDRWTQYRRGRLERDEVDRNYDGKPDAWSYFSGGRIARSEEDQNFDGKVDTWTHYSEGRPATSNADTDFSGRPDVLYFHRAGEVFRADWIDQDSGELWKRDGYRHGYLHESLLDTDRDGVFDRKITYDAFEQPIRTETIQEPVRPPAQEPE